MRLDTFMWKILSFAAVIPSFYLGSAGAKAGCTTVSKHSNITTYLQIATGDPG